MFAPKHAATEARWSGEDHSPPAGSLAPQQGGAMGTGARAAGALAVGALAIGALAIGALAVGRLAIGRARIRRLEIDELVVHRLCVIDTLQTPPTVPPSINRHD